MNERTPEPPLGDGPVALRASTCPPCGKPVDPLRARHFAVHDGRVVSFCSPDCKDLGAETPVPLVVRVDTPDSNDPTEQLPRIELRRRPRPWRFIAAATPLVLGAGVLMGARVSFDGRTATAALPAKPPALPAPAPEPDPPYGPELPPADQFVESDSWCHPLPGPVRRLPERPTRMFGVGRDHDSPASCLGGHCGVDVGEVAGEPVLAVHDGTVERVVRDESLADRSGRYVRILHYGGRIVTQYMHLASIEAALKPGYHVRAGEKIGAVGASGTQNSGPHLHFTFATRKDESSPEVYVDPLALLTTWPLVER